MSSLCSSELPRNMVKMASKSSSIIGLIEIYSREDKGKLY